MMFPKALSFMSNQVLISDWFLGGLLVSSTVSVLDPPPSLCPVNLVTVSYSGAGNLFVTTFHWPWERR